MNIITIEYRNTPSEIDEIPEKWSEFEIVYTYQLERINGKNNEQQIIYELTGFEV